MTEQTRFPMPKPSDMGSMSSGRAPTIPTPAPSPSPAVARSWQEDSKPKAQAQTMPESNVVKDLRLPLSLLNTKTFLAIIVVVFLIGIAFGGALFGGGSKNTQANTGLKGLVRNTDVENGLTRCGLAPRGERCVLYVMNNIRREVKASELFDRAAQMTGVARYRIDLANVAYTTTIIKPGQIAQIAIPKD